MSVYVLIPLLPLAAFVVLALSGGRWGTASHRVAVPAVGLSFGLSVVALIDVGVHGPVSISLYRFIHSGSLVVDLDLYLDQLTVLFLPLVTGVSGVVHVYSARYMIGDPRYCRFFAVTALLTFAMVMLVMSNNLLLLYVAWEIMGLCAYLLIAHQAERPSACHAATKAFVVNAAADVGLGFGVILTLATFGTLDIQQILSMAGAMSGQTVNLLGWAGLEWPVQTVTLITLFLFLGAMGKSAQGPFHVWLPPAVEAPTPASAMTQAVTTLNAGPFLLIRLSPLVALAPTTMTVIAVVGLATALCAAVVSLTQTDVKAILSYATISQIGFVMMACGVGAFAAAVFHVLAHGCLKGFLFLSTGNALQSVHAGGQAAADAGRGSRPRGVVCLGSLVLACIPPLVIFSGPYEQLWTAQNFASARAAFLVAGLLAVFAAAMSIFRGVFVLFQHSPVPGRPGNAVPVLPRPQVFSPFHFPVIVLGIVVAAGALAALWTWVAQFLAPALGQFGREIPDAAAPARVSFWLMASLAAAVCGWGVAYARHVLPGRGSFGRSEWGKTLYVLFLNKLYVDELIEAFVVRPTLRFAGWLWRTVDLGGVDRFVTGLAGVSVALGGWLWRVLDIRGIDRVVVGTGGQTMSMARWLWRYVEMHGPGERIEPFLHADAADRPARAFEPRTLRHHMLVMVFWLIVAMGLFYWFAA